MTKNHTMGVAPEHSYLERLKVVIPLFIALSFLAGNVPSSWRAVVLLLTAIGRTLLTTNKKEGGNNPGLCRERRWSAAAKRGA
jgi:hypothetical protein